jgi:hypothetical protein
MRALVPCLLSLLVVGSANARKPAPRVALARPVLVEAPPPAIVAPPDSGKTTTTVMVSQQRRWGLFGGGVALFVAGYAADIGASYGLKNPGASHSIVPLIGPLIQMGDKWTIQMETPKTGDPMLDAQVSSRVNEVNNQIQTAAYVVLAIDFALQASGVIMAIVGATTKHTKVTYEKSPPPMGLSKVQWTLVPGPTPTVALRF